MILECIFLFSLMKCSFSDLQSMQLVIGEVEAGNYTRYSLLYKGYVSLYLKSEQGDADLYVSQFVEKPTYEPDTYCLQSATCDLDVIHIPKSFKRPLYIGVYGHPFHDISVYRLDVVFREKNSDIICLEEESLPEEDLQEESFLETSVNSSNDIDGLDERSEKTNESPTVFPLLLTFANLLVELLFL